MQTFFLENEAQTSEKIAVQCLPHENNPVCEIQRFQQCLVLSKNRQRPFSFDPFKYYFEYKTNEIKLRLKHIVDICAISILIIVICYISLVLGAKLEI